MKASIQLTMEQPTMFRWLPSTLFGLLLIFLMVACTPATTTDDSALSDENLEIATDSSTDSPDQASTEPPAATLTIDGQEQNAGINGDCWQQGDGTSICADGIGFTTPPDPIQAESTILAQFEFILDAKLERVQLSIFPASQPVLMGPNESDWRYWKTEGELPDTNRGVLLEEITAEDRIIYLPVQPPSGASMAALNERTLVEVDGCLRIDNGHYAGGWLVLWPYGSDIQVTDNSIEVINEDGKPVGRVGEWMRAGGGAVENSHGMAGIDEMIPGMPIDGCPGPYWVAAPFETMDEQSVPDIYFQPFSDNDQILAWFVNQ